MGNIASGIAGIGLLFIAAISAMQWKYRALRFFTIACLTYAGALLTHASQFPLPAALQSYLYSLSSLSLLLVHLTVARSKTPRWIYLLLAGLFIASTLSAGSWLLLSSESTLSSRTPLIVTPFVMMLSMLSIAHWVSAIAGPLNTFSANARFRNIALICFGIPILISWLGSGILLIAGSSLKEEIGLWAIIGMVIVTWPVFAITGAAAFWLEKNATVDASATSDIESKRDHL